MKNIIIKIIKKYQNIPFKSHDSCKYIPTCSNYMIEALEEHVGINLQLSWDLKGILWYFFIIFINIFFIYITTIILS